MPVLDLSAYKPVPGTLEDANQIANGMQAIQNCINGLDNNNFAAGKIFDPLKLMQDGATAGQGLVWNAAANGGTGGWVPGAVASILAIGFRTTPLSTAGTTFAGGADLLGAALSFTADGVSSYLVEVSADGWTSSVAAGSQQVATINLDGAAGAQPAFMNIPTANLYLPLFGRGRIVTPAAGVHTVNVRFFTSAGTMTVDAGAGGAGASTPAVVLVRRET